MSTTPRKVIRVSDFGVIPNSINDAVPGIAAALAACRAVAAPVTLRFPPGYFHLYAANAAERCFPMSNTDVLPKRNLGILLEGLDEITLEGKGTELILHGSMSAIAVDNCNHVTMSGFVIDTFSPCNVTAQVIAVSSTRVDLFINCDVNHFIVRNGRLGFKVDDDTEYWAGECMEFESTSNRVRPGSGDWVLGAGRYACIARRTDEDTVSLHGLFTHLPSPGNFLVLRHGKRSHAGIYLQGCSDVTIEDLEMHGNKGLGILAQDCKNLVFRNVNHEPTSGLIAAGHDDGLHISGCRGSVLIEDCHFAGLMDDPINVHGTSVKVTAQRGKQIRARFMHPQSIDLNWAHPGDEVAVLERGGLTPLTHAKVKRMKGIDARNLVLELEKPLDITGSPRLALENLSAAPEVTIRNCRFDPCRARGLLISTPQTSVIENCTFDSSGSAILVAGDANYWWESGAVGDLTIRNNTFSGFCNSSAYQFCEAVISIFPSLPRPGAPFHGHICIEGNHFTTGGDPVLYALSVRELEFINNSIEYSPEFPTRLPGKALLTLDACARATIQGNDLDPECETKKILLRRMTRAQIMSDLG
jgi:parallel beta-helix repeat protein